MAIESALLGIVGLSIMFLPTILAVLKKKKNATPIFLVNFLLGWTVIGWIVALIWATTYEEGERKLKIGKR